MSTIDINKLPEVGYGYRWLEDKEMVQKGDEVYSSFIDRYNGQDAQGFLFIVNGYGLTLESYRSWVTNQHFHDDNPINIRRKIDVGEGYRLVNPSEIILENDEHIYYYYSKTYCGRWFVTNSADNKVSTIWPSNYNKIGLAYRRKIINKTEEQIEKVKYTTSMSPLEQKVDELSKTVKKLEEQIFNNKCAAQEPVNTCDTEKIVKEDKFKPGDYVTRTAGGSPPIEIDKTYQIKSVCGGDELILEDFAGYWGKMYFRLATKEETEYYLLEKAKQQGFKVGVKTKMPDGNILTISELKVIFNYVPENYCSYYVSRRFSEPGTAPFVAAMEIKNIPASCPISRLEIVKEDEKIVITVDNVDYIAQFLPGYVKFGCAEITNNQIIDSLYLFKKLYNNAHGNREITTVQIGKGLFNKEILEKLYKNLKY